MSAALPRPLTPALLLIGAMISVTLGASMAKTLFQLAGPSGVTAVRIGVGSLLLALWFRPWHANLRGPQAKLVITYGICLGTMNLLFYHAVARLPLGVAIAIEFLGPLSIALFYSKKAIDLAWALFAATGVALLLPLTLSTNELDPLGILAAVGAGACWATYIVVGKKAGAALPGGIATSLGMLVAFVAVLPFGFEGFAKILGAGPRYMVCALAVGLLSSAIPYSLEMAALRALPEKYFSLLLSLEPAIGALIALAWLGERLRGGQWIAIGCVVLASVGSSLTHRRQATVPPAP